MKVIIQVTANVDSGFLQQYLAARGLSNHTVLECLKGCAGLGFDELQTHFETTGNDGALKYECSIAEIQNGKLPPSLQG